MKEGERREKEVFNKTQQKHTLINFFPRFTPTPMHTRKCPFLRVRSKTGVKEGKKFKRPNQSDQPFLFRNLVLRIAMICTECKFYQPLESWQRPYLPVNVRFGECRRSPPVASRQPDDRDHQYQASFPTVQANDWCGEFAPRVAQVAVSRVDQANTAFDTASQEDATVANVGAVTGQCQSGRESRATGRD